MSRSVSCFCIALLLLSCAEVRAEFTAIAGWEKQLFPSYIIATASIKGADSAPENTLGDPRGLLGISVVSPAHNTPVKVTIKCDDITEVSEFSGKLPKKDVNYKIFPKLKFRYQDLAKFDQASSVSVSYRVQLGGAPAEEQTITLLVRSISDCPFLVAVDNQQIDTSFAFAAYVNEQHPFVDKLLREALDIGMVDKFTGYQIGGEAQVILQAYALWDLLVARDIRYSSITATAGEAETVASQHVRLLEDTVNNSQANCVDGSVLWVSLMRKIGIEAFLVHEPGHCYAGFYVDEERTTCFAIETTMLGEEVDLATVQVPKAFKKAVDEEIRDDETFASFVAAIQLGTARFNKHAAKFNDAKEARYRVIDISEARQIGILPIAFKGKQDFVEYDHSARFADDSSEESELDSLDDETEDEDEDDDKEEEEEDTQ